MTVPTPNTPHASKRPGLVESALQKLFTRQARVDSIEDLHSKFRLITLSGDALKNVSWTPGNKIQIQFGGWAQRTYTPLHWDFKEGRTQILVYLHADGPGTRWARLLRVGDTCHLFGPRRSVELTHLQSPALFFGDETSLGLAWAIKKQEGNGAGTEFLFELSRPLESFAAMESPNFSIATHIIHTNNEAHWLEVEATMRDLLASHRPVEFVLTGKSTSVQKLHKMLRQEGVSASRIHARAYWAPGKKGLD